jgi:hypothetical protein
MFISLRLAVSPSRIPNPDNWYIHYSNGYLCRLYSRFYISHIRISFVRNQLFEWQPEDAVPDRNTICKRKRDFSYETKFYLSSCLRSWYLIAWITIYVYRYRCELSLKKCTLICLSYLFLELDVWWTFGGMSFVTIMI